MSILHWNTKHPRQPTAPGRILTKGMMTTMTKKLRLTLLKKYNILQKQIIDKSGKLEILSMTKYNVKFDEYRDHLGLSERVSIAKLRHSAHNLSVEKGRKYIIIHLMEILSPDWLIDVW